MLRTLLVWGLLAGLCGGALAAGAGSIVGEPVLDRAIAWESAEAHAAGEPHEHALVSRAVQGSVGLLAGAAIYGCALGGIFALVFAGVYGRISRAGPARTALGLGAAAFVVVYLVPFLKYPASPPGTTEPGTIGQRSALFAGMIAVSLLAAVAALRLRRNLLRRVGGDVATIGATGAYIAVVLLGGAIMPAVEEMPAAFPASMLWEFREASVAVQLVMWTTIALVFAAAAQRRIAGTASVPRASLAGARLHG
jgi:predicted cobalt transporter CbtA